jgi:hypothetical protein
MTIHCSSDERGNQGECCPACESKVGEWPPLFRNNTSPLRHSVCQILVPEDMNSWVDNTGENEVTLKLQRTGRRVKRKVTSTKVTLGKMANGPVT